MLFVDLGPNNVGAVFANDRAAENQTVEGSAGSSAHLRFDPPKAKHHGDDGKDKSGDGGSSDTPPPVDDKTKKPWGIHPAVFGVALGVTAVLGAVTIWSGVDAINNPGADAVKKDCVGLGTSCPAYQEGLSHQRRTNILIGVTSGTAAVTIILAIVTNWHGSAKKPDDPANPPAPKDARFRVTEPRLWLDVLGAKASRALPDRGSVVGDSLPGLFREGDGAMFGISGRFF